MPSCLGEPLGHLLRPYITTLNFLSIEFLLEAGSLLRLAEVVAELLTCLRVAAYVGTLLLVLSVLLLSVLLND